jgi:hypothetical protein
MLTPRDGTKNSVNFGRVDYGPADMHSISNQRLTMGEWISLPSSSAEMTRRAVDSVRPSGPPSKPIIKRISNVDSDLGFARDSTLDMDTFTKIANREEVRTQATAASRENHPVLAAATQRLAHTHRRDPPSRPRHRSSSTPSTRLHSEDI